MASEEKAARLAEREQALEAKLLEIERERETDTLGTVEGLNDADDEGEDDFLTFINWAAAESAGLAAYDATRRYWSIDRAFTPGAARPGAIVWTGDINPSWSDLQQTPGLMLNWALAGAPYVTCDIGGFSGQTNALLLSRWYGVGVFMPVMRVHSTRDADPHFPFPELWGAEASDAMRTLLELRYALLPHLYSLAHETFSAGLPIVRPMVMEFPDAATAALTSQWMLGDALLVAPVLDDSNATSVVLPALPPGRSWFEWGSARAHAGAQTLSLPAVPLNAVPAFARAGAIFTLAPPIQFSDALPGGPLSVAVYAGADGAFTLHEDDGETRAYAAGAVATLAFSWDDASGCLSWARGGVAGEGGVHAFTQLSVTAYFASGATRTAPAQDIGEAAGKACPA
jgi:alpha-glucosidase